MIIFCRVIYFLCMAINSPTTDNPIAPEGLHIIQAQYGAGTKWIDVSDKLRQKVRNDTLETPIGNFLAGDPAYGDEKRLKITYDLNGDRKTIEVREGQWLIIESIPDLPAKGLYIINAQYGAEQKQKDATREIREKVRNDTLDIKVSDDIVGNPAPGVQKTLRIKCSQNGTVGLVQARQGQWIHIPPDIERNPDLKPAFNWEQLNRLIKECPAELGFYGKNFLTGKTVEYRPDQPACLASIVKIFVLLEIMRQVENSKIALNETIEISKTEKTEICTIDDALDKMIRDSDNEATNALAARVGYANINALPKLLGLSGLSDQILPEPGVLDTVLNQRVCGQNKPGCVRLLLHVLIGNSEPYMKMAESLLPQHGTAKGIASYFELLYQKKLITESVSDKVLEVFDRHPISFAPTAMPADYKSCGKGGSLDWQIRDYQQYNMVGWGSLIRNQNTGISFCLWCEWFPEQTSEDLKRKWLYTISDSIVNILLEKKMIPTDIPR